MNKAEFLKSIEEAKKEFYIGDDTEAEEACHFVAKLIQAECERIIANEPHATRTLADLEKMESAVYGFFENDIQNSIEEFDK